MSCLLRISSSSTSGCAINKCSFRTPKDVQQRRENNPNTELAAPDPAAAAAAAAAAAPNQSNKTKYQLTSPQYTRNRNPKP